MSPVLLRRTWPNRHSQAAFTLREIMVAVGVFMVATSLFYESFRTNLILSIKSVSLNDSNAALQTSFGQIQSTLENQAILVDCATYDPGAKTFTAVADGTWANAVRFMTLQPVIGYILPDDGSKGCVQTSQPVSISNPPDPTRGQVLLHTDSQSNSNKITFSYNSSLYPMASAPVPTGARFYPAFPITSETVSTGSSPGSNKPGLGISSITFSDTGYTSTTGKASVTLTNNMTATGTGHTVSDCTRGYILVEGALVVLPDYAGGPKKLLYFSNTNQPSNYAVVAISLDGADQTPPDAAAAATSGNFCHVSGDTAVKTILPIRTRDYSNALAGAGRGGALADTNAWIRITTKFRNRQTL